MPVCNSHIVEWETDDKMEQDSEEGVPDADRCYGEDRSTKRDRGTEGLLLLKRSGKASLRR